MKKIVKELLELLIEKKLTVALAESVTCGLASHQLNITGGTSEAFIGSVVCYNEDVKKTLLKVSPSLIEKYTTESQEITDELAKNLPQIFKADIYGAITGLASPGGSETASKPVGTVFFSLLYGEKLVREKKIFKGAPLAVKKQACEHLYKMILKQLQQ